MIPWSRPKVPVGHTTAGFSSFQKEHRGRKGGAGKITVREKTAAEKKKEGDGEEE
jgi:hypothetical protein